MPEFKCRENCGECCGVVPINSAVYYMNCSLKSRNVSKVTPLGDELIAETEDGICCFLNDDKRCNIYNDRPEICRNYGVKELMPCPYVKLP